MSSYLVFQLYGPMQSWGGPAVGEIRSSGARPSRSALLGLLAAVLGVRRDNETKHEQMAEAYGLAVRPLTAGGRMTDYHTSQCGKRRSKRAYRVRLDEVGGLLARDEDAATNLSRREYLTDAAFAVCVWSQVAAPPFTLAEIEKGLIEPVFAPYLGRKSCPPALPFEPQRGEFEGPVQALLGYNPKINIKSLLSLDALPPREVYLPPQDSPAQGEDLTVTDEPLSRTRRQFAHRLERRITLDDEAPEVNHVHE